MKKIFTLTLTMLFATSIIDAKVYVPPVYGEPGYGAAVVAVPVEGTVVVNPYAKHMKNVVKTVQPEKVHARNLEAAEIKQAALAPAVVVAPVRRVVAAPVVVAPVRHVVVDPYARAAVVRPMGYPYYY